MNQPRTMSAEETQALDRVRRRVTAVAFLAVALHGVVGLIVVGAIVDGQGRHSDAIGLTVMSGVVALIICVATRAILGARPVHVVWLALSLVPTAVALARLV